MARGDSDGPAVPIEDTGTDDTGDACVQGWTAAGLTVCPGGIESSYTLGLAETGSPTGWYGEDCIEGVGPNSLGYDICHDQIPPEGLVLLSVHTPEDVVANHTTLLTDAQAGGITYLFQGNDTGQCWTTGNDTSYYADFACTEM
jgi:hypothetical protein